MRREGGSLSVVLVVAAQFMSSVQDGWLVDCLVEEWEYAAGGACLIGWCSAWWMPSLLTSLMPSLLTSLITSLCLVVHLGSGAVGVVIAGWDRRVAGCIYFCLGGINNQEYHPRNVMQCDRENCMQIY